jgi:hypothetical protein
LGWATFGHPQAFHRPAVQPDAEALGNSPGQFSARSGGLIGFGLADELNYFD